MHPEMVADVIANIERLGGVVDRERETDLLTINGEFSASLVLARCRNTEAGHHRWLIRFDAGLGPDITLAVRMAPGNHEILDYYLLSQVDSRPAKLRMGQDNGLDLDCFRFNDLSFFFGMAERSDCLWPRDDGTPGDPHDPHRADHRSQSAGTNKRFFGDIVTNIAHLGLKRPITVTRRDKGAGSEHYDLVCGQGRLEAYRALGQAEIPAMVIDASEEDCLVMSLVENIARRQHRQIELVQEIGNLRRRAPSSDASPSQPA